MHSVLDYYNHTRHGATSWMKDMEWIQDFAKDEGWDGGGDTGILVTMIWSAKC